MKRKQYIKFYLLMLISIFLVVMILYLLSNTILKNELNEIKKIEVKHIQSFAKNIKNRILYITNDNIVKSIKHNPSVKKGIKDILSLFLNNKYRYIYMIYIDNKGLSKNLLNISNNISQKSEYEENFKLSSNVLKKVFSTTNPIYFLNKKISTLWLTYLYPIQYKKNEKVILVFEISSNEYNNLFSIIKTMHKILLFSLLFLIVILLFSFFQAYLYFRQKEKNGIDPLTRLYNRYYLKQIAKSIDLTKYTILMIDIDFFKKINDTYGHKIGDIVLESVARRILGATRTSDIVIRYGGEEFLVFLNKQKDIKDICRRILKSISNKPIRIKDKNISISVSIGVNTSPQKYNSLTDAIEIADEMLYEAKRTGRNKIIFSDEKNKQDRIMLENQITSALKDGRLKAFFQPILDIKTGQIIEYEALARIIDERGNVYLPYQFLPIIQQTPSYIELTKNILLQSFEMIKLHSIKVSINLNMDDFLNDNIFNLLINTIKEYMQYAQKLTIEIYDSNYIDNLELLTKRIKSIKSYGVKIAVDSFGINSLNLEYIITTKPEYIKIDGSIISKISSSNELPSKIVDIIKICKTLNIKTVAEFVENKEILNVLKESGIDMAQGYYIGKPQNLLSKKYASKVLFLS